MKLNRDGVWVGTGHYESLILKSWGIKSVFIFILT